LVRAGKNTIIELGYVVTAGRKVGGEKCGREVMLEGGRLRWLSCSFWIECVKGFGMGGKEVEGESKWA